MTDEFRSFRILLVPGALLLIFFILSPRLCARAVMKAKEAKEQKAAAPAAEPETATSEGLKIVSLSPRAAAPKPSNFPEGLDAARIQYLVEIDPLFAAPRTAALPKKFDASDEVTKTLMKMQYAEKQEDGTTALTREGALYLRLTEEGDKWTFPIATRSFVAVTNVSRVEDDKYDATFAWHWEPTAIGTQLKIDGQHRYSAIARFSGGERHWALTQWIGAIEIK